MILQQTHTYVLAYSTRKLFVNYHPYDFADEYGGGNHCNNSWLIPPMLEDHLPLNLARERVDVPNNPQLYLKLLQLFSKPGEYLHTSCPIVY